MIAELFGRSDEIQNFTSFLFSLLVFVVGAGTAGTDINDIAFTIVMRLEFTVTERTVKGGRITGSNFVREGILTDFTGILTSAVVKVKITVISTAPGTAALVGKVLTMLNGFNRIQSNKVIKTKLVIFPGDKLRGRINEEIGIRDHRILGFLFPGIGMNPGDKRQNEIVKILKSGDTVIKLVQENGIRKQVRDIRRNGLKEINSSDIGFKKK